MAYKSVNILNFYKGITDKPEDGDIQAAEKLDNVNLRDNGKPETRDGSWVASDLSFRTTNQLSAKLVLEYLDDTIYIAGGKAYIDDTSTFAELQGVNTAIEIFPEADDDTFYSHFEWKDQFIVTSNAMSRPVKFFKDDARGWQVVSVGLPALATAPVVSVSGGSDSFSYIAGFCHKYTYKINSVDYIVRGPVTQVQFIGASGGTFEYNSIPALANGADTHYDLINTDIEIYRTLQNGVILYLDKTINNGVTSTTSDNDDLTIEQNARVYTDGGVLDNDPPPKCRYVMQAQNYAYYLCVTGETSKGLESKADEIDAVPGGNSFKADKEITGGGVIFDDFFVYAKDRWYVLKGHYDNKGAGSVIPSIISNTDGTKYNTSFVNTTFGAVAFGQNSFIYCDRNKILPISGFDELYKKLSDNSSDDNPVVGTFDPINKRVYWSCKNASQTEHNDAIYVFHEKLWAGGVGAFTTWSGSKYFSPRYIKWLKNNKLFRGDDGGWLLVHDSKYKYDPMYKASSLVSSWDKEAIKEDIITSYLFGDDHNIRKWGCKLLINCLNRTNLTIQPSCATDGSKDFKPMSKIDIRTQATWGESHLYWKETKNLYWKDALNIKRIVNMPSGFARFNSRQLRFQKGLSIVYRPEQGYADTVTIDAINMKATFNGNVPANIINKYLLINPYSKLFLIVNKESTNVFKISDPSGSLVDGTYKWYIKAYPLYQVFSPIEFIMYYVDYGESFSGTRPQGVVATK